MGFNFVGLPIPFDAPVIAAVDSGTSLISLPRRDGHRVASAMFGHLVGQCFWVALGGNSILLCDCGAASEAHPLDLDIGGTPYQLRAGDMFQHVSGVGMCSAGLMLGDDPFWILGDVFMRNKYIVHNYKEQSMTFFARDAMASDSTEFIAKSIPSGMTARLKVLVVTAVALWSSIGLTFMGRSYRRDHLVSPLGEPFLVTK